MRNKISIDTLRPVMDGLIFEVSNPENKHIKSFKGNDFEVLVNSSDKKININYTGSLKQPRLPVCNFDNRENNLHVINLVEATKKYLNNKTEDNLDALVKINTPASIKKESKFRKIVRRRETKRMCNEDLILEYNAIVQDNKETERIYNINMKHYEDELKEYNKEIDKIENNYRKIVNLKEVENMNASGWTITGSIPIRIK